QSGARHLRVGRRAGRDRGRRPRTRRGTGPGRRPGRPGPRPGGRPRCAPSDRARLAPDGRDRRAAGPVAGVGGAPARAPAGRAADPARSSAPGGRLMRRAAFAAAALLATSGSLAAQRHWRPEDRLVLRDYTRVVAVAAGLDRAYAVTPDAVLVLDARTRRWTGVAEAPEPGALGRTGLALVDPLDNALWLAGRNEWFRYQPDLQLWERGLTPGAVTQIAFDRADPTGGLYLRTRGGWAIVPRIGGAALPGQAPRQPVFATRLEEAFRAN